MVVNGYEKDKELEMEKSYKINPKVNFYEAEYYLKESCSSNARITANSGVYDLVGNLSNNILCSSKDKYEKCWEDFYLPLKRSGREVCIPFTIVKYKNDFFCYFFRLGNLQIKRGNKRTDQMFNKIFQEAIRFAQLSKKTKENIVKRTVPYDFRTGKILGRHILDIVMSQKEKEKILKEYTHHQQKKFKTRNCSLSEYLHVASLCYKSVYGQKTRNLNPLEMYKRWADKRDGGMLSIKDWNSKKSFLNWHKRGEWTGSHPFEIVFSWHRHGIHLYPPLSHDPWKYCLAVTNYAYAMAFIRMTRALIRHKIPFIAHNLKEVLDYLAGETYFTVNNYSDNHFFYIPSQEHKKKYFKYVEWDELKVADNIIVEEAKPEK